MTKIIRILAVVILLGAALAAAGCGSPSSSGGATASAGAPAAGSPAPDFSLNNLDGQAVSLSSFKGHPVLLNFWATWCPPCKAEIPYIQAISTNASWTSRGLEIVAVDDRETRQDVVDFMGGIGMTYRVLLDTKGNVFDLYNVQGIPTTYFIDKDGIIQYVRVGEFAQKADIEKILNSMITK